MAILAAVVSCSKRSGIVEMQSNEIIFGVENGLEINATTKAITQTTVETLENDGFYVSAMQLDEGSYISDILDNVYVEKVGNVWKDSVQKRYFPIGDYTYAFFAAYSSCWPICISDNWFYYELDSSGDDLVTAYTESEPKLAPVMLTFNHALAQASFTVKGTDQEADYYLNSITLKYPYIGEFDIGSNEWLDTGGEHASTLYSGSAKKISTTTHTAIGTSMAFLPGEVEIRVCWTCKLKGTDFIIAEYDKNASISLVQGVKSQVDIMLPDNNAAKLGFSVVVNAWETKHVPLTMSN